VRSSTDLARIRALAVPPAWTEVWICPDPNGHIQAVGRDARGRRQYRYHAAFRARRSDEKFGRLRAFGERLPRIRRRARRDLALRGLPREKVLGAVVTLLDTTAIRIGNAEYAQLNRSFGASTLRSRHAVVRGSTVRFRFRGKGGRQEERALVDRRMAAIVRRCQDLPGQELFQYLDADGEARAVTSEDVNAYLRAAAGTDDVSAKDFRTWRATVLAYRALRAGVDGTQLDGDRRPPRRGQGRVMEALRVAAAELGDTVAVTRSAYVHPGVLEAFNSTDPPDRRPPRAPETRRRGAAAVQPDRRDELELLALLRRSARHRNRAPRRQESATRGRAPHGSG
jgi:DNA topoisomerase-1